MQTSSGLWARPEGSERRNCLGPKRRQRFVERRCLNSHKYSQVQVLGTLAKLVHQVCHDRMTLGREIAEEGAQELPYSVDDEEADFAVT